MVPKEELNVLTKACGPVSWMLSALSSLWLADSARTGAEAWGLENDGKSWGVGDYVEE